MLWFLCSIALFVAFLFRAGTLPLSSPSEPGKDAVDPILITRGLYAASAVTFYLWLSSSSNHTMPHIVMPSAAAAFDGGGIGSTMPGALQGHSVLSIGLNKELSPFLSSMASTLGAQVIVSLSSATNTPVADMLPSYGLAAQQNLAAVELASVSSTLPKASSGVHVLVSDSLFADASTSLPDAVDALIAACQSATPLKSVLLVSRVASTTNGDSDLAQGMLNAAIDYASVSLDKLYDASVIHVVSGRNFGQADEQTLLSLMVGTESMSWDAGTRFVLPSALADGVVQTYPKQHQQQQQHTTAGSVEKGPVKVVQPVYTQHTQDYNRDQGSARQDDESSSTSSSHRSVFLALLLRLFGTAFPVLMTHRLLATLLTEENENEIRRVEHAAAMETRLGGDHKFQQEDKALSSKSAKHSMPRSRADSEDCTHESDLERDLWFSYWIIFSAVCLFDDYFVPSYFQSIVFVPLIALLAWSGAMPGATGALNVYALFVEPARELVSQLDSVVASQIVKREIDFDNDTDGEPETDREDVDMDEESIEQNNNETEKVAKKVDVQTEYASDDEPSGGRQFQDVQVKYAAAPPPMPPLRGLAE